MPNDVTIERASAVASCRSSWTPVETQPNSIRSPAAPATITISCMRRSGSCMIVWSRSVSMCAAVPSVRPRATIESLRAIALVPSASVTTACEDSWTAITQRSCSVRMCLLRRAGDDAVDRLLERRLVDLALAVAHASAAPPR